MKILWVKPGKLLPLDTGGKLRTYNILRQLSTTNNLTYLSYYGGKRDDNYEREILEHLPGTITIHTAAPDTTELERRLDYLYRLTWTTPYAVSKFTDKKVKRLLSEWIPQRKFDVAVCDFLSSALNFPRSLATPTVLFQHNVECVLWERKAKFEVKWVDRMISKIEYSKMLRCEPTQVRRFHHVIAVSEQDREAMKWMVDPSCISVVPTGVDLKKFRYDPKSEPAGPLVVFTGSMDWEANIDGVEYFCREIWPLVLVKVPRAKFQIVGRDPHPRVKNLASDSVEVTGTVPSIVDYLKNAAVFVIPLRIGGGTRIKIYEGMAVGKATVSTAVGAEGLDVHHGENIMLADDPKAFSEAIVTFLRDENTRHRFEAAAAATASKYDWSVISQRFVEILQKTVDATESSSAILATEAVEA
ncbi:MAG: glycosyltransferase family 4 protein [Acidobacteriota bacterium]|nr:glycosyltransferase family 4 protein [Acidobacteriota bacterium]